MKKYSILFTFICVLFLGVHTATAQENAEVRAKNRTIKLEKTLELSSQQVKQVYQIFLDLERENSSSDAEALNSARKKISDVLQPKQREEFYRSFRNERMRQEKVTEANRNRQ